MAYNIYIFLGTFVDSVENDSASHSGSGQESEEYSDESYDKVEAIKLPVNSISRGLSISAIRQKKTSIKFDIINTRIVGRRQKYVVSKCYMARFD